MANIAGQFSALPMKDLIGGPLQATCDAQVLLAQASADFINNVGLQTDKDGHITAKTVDFSFKQAGAPDASGNPTQETVEMSVPLLAILNTPSLSVKEAEVKFTMSVSSSETSENSSDSSGSFNASGSANFGFYKMKCSMSGSVASHSSNTRKSDNSAKYDVRVIARDDGPPEGLMKMLDILQGAIKPSTTAAPATPPATNP